MARILITGITGFMGKYLTKMLLEKNHQVYGNIFDRDESPPDANESLHLKFCDVRIKDQVTELINESKPNFIYHLAAQSLPMKSWKDPKETMDTNFSGTINLFNSILEQKLEPKILVACSSAEYGFTAITKNRALNEEDPLEPVHPYGLSKVCQDMISKQYFLNYGMKVIRARIFNTIGPGKKNDFVGDVSMQISKILKNKQDPTIQIGNLETERDISDVRDQIKALTSLLENGVPGEVYNVCSGRVVKMKELLDKMIAISGKDIKINKDPKKIRKIDEPLILGDPSKIRKECSWNEEITIDKTLTDSINFWN